MLPRDSGEAGFGEAKDWRGEQSEALRNSSENQRNAFALLPLSSAYGSHFPRLLRGQIFYTTNSSNDYNNYHSETSHNEVSHSEA